MSKLFKFYNLIAIIIGHCIMAIMTFAAIICGYVYISDKFNDYDK